MIRNGKYIRRIGGALTYLIAWSCSFSASAQQIGVGTATPHPSSVLDVSDTLRGILIPRLTTQQRDNIANPADGLIIFNVERACFETYDASIAQWRSCTEEPSLAAVDTQYRCGAYGELENPSSVPGPIAEEWLSASVMDAAGRIWMVGGTPISGDYLVLARVNASLDLDWWKIPSQYAFGGWMGSDAIARMPNNDIVVGSLAHGYNTAWVARFNSNGNVVWSKYYGMLTPANVDAIAIDNGGNIVVAGSTAGIDYYVMKLTGAGDTVWHTLFPFIHNGDTHVVGVSDMAVNSNNEIVCAGRYNGKWAVFKLNSAGDTVWFKTYQAIDSNGAAAAVTLDANDNIYVAGWMRHGAPPYDEAVLMKLNTDGDVLWHSMIGGDLHDYFSDVLLLPGGDIVAVGHTLSFTSRRTPALNRLGSDAYAVRFSPSGVPKWTRTYGGAFSDEARQVHYRNGKLWITGSTGSFGFGGNDFFLIVADPETGDACCASGMGGRRSYAPITVKRPAPGVLFPPNPVPADIQGFINFSAGTMKICK